MDLDTDRNIDFKNLPYQEGIISETYERPDKSYIQGPTGIGRSSRYHQISPKVSAQKMDIDKIPDRIKRKVLKGTHLPLMIKEIQAGYLTSSSLQRPIPVFGPE